MMLKLNTIDGKFDIVFAGDPLLGKKKLNTSGGLHQTNKSNVLPRDRPKAGGRKGKNVNAAVRNTQDQRTEKVVPSDRKPPKKSPLKAADKHDVRAKANIVGKVSDQKENTKKDLKINPKHEEKSTERTTTAAVVSKRSDSDGGMYSRRNLPVNMNTGGDNGYGRNPNTTNVGVISREDLNNMFRGFFEEHGGFVQPVSVPEPSPPHHDYPVMVDEAKAASLQCPQVPAQVQEEEYNPWGRLGGGAPPLRIKRSDKYDSEATQYSSPPPYPYNNNNNNGNSNNSNQTRTTYQHNAHEDYNPWGRPGCGAPLKDKDDNTIADLKSYGKTNYNRSESNPSKFQHSDYGAGRGSGGGDKGGEILRSDEATSSTQQPLALSYNSTFARGKGKSVHELQETERRRQKELEHQAAIRRQVEEKRRLKQLQKEKELEEEAKAEERFRREQQKILEVNEMEKRKQQEQEEKMRRQQELLQERIRVANLEAKKAKELKQRESTKYITAGITLNTRPDEQQQQQQNQQQHLHHKRRLHNDEDIIVPAATSKFSEDIPGNNSSKISNSDSNNYNHRERTFGGKENLTRQRQDSYTEASKFTTDLDKDESNSKENKGTIISKSTHQRPLAKTVTYPKNMYGEKDIRSDTRHRPRKMDDTKTNSNNDMGVVDSSPDCSEHVVPYHRTQTTELLDSPKGSGSSDLKRSPKEQKKEQTLPDVTSVRQQQILDQLHALRQGLMRKEREYVMDKYS